MLGGCRKAVDRRIDIAGLDVLSGPARRKESGTEGDLKEGAK